MISLYFLFNLYINKIKIIKINLFIVFLIILNKYKTPALKLLNYLKSPIALVLSVTIDYIIGTAANVAKST